jgi:hypothetical protein
MKKSFYVLFVATIFIMPACNFKQQNSANKQNELKEKIKKELASGKRNDTIFLGLMFGMSENQYINYFKELNRSGKIYTNKKNEYEYKFNFGAESIPREGFATFHGEFFNDQLYKLYVSVEPGEYGYNAQLCQHALVDIYKSKYDDMIIETPIFDDKRPEYIWIDGNRKIEIIAVVTEARIIYTDLISEQEKAIQDSIISKKNKEAIKVDILNLVKKPITKL